MLIFYFMVFGGLAAMVAALEFSKTSRDRINTSSTFSSFKNNYLIVYSLMMAGDWLQGPYVCYLYSQYGFGKGEIGQLFIAGFGSSMLFGTIVGSLADKQGRKRGCIIYCITYTLSCATKHSPDYNILMLGLYWEALLLLFFFQPLSLGLLRNTSRGVLINNDYQ